MKHAVIKTAGFKPITLTITMETPADALLIWATLGVTIDAVRKVAESINIPTSKALLMDVLKAGIASGTYPIWDDLDDRLREMNLLYVENQP